MPWYKFLADHGPGHQSRTTIFKWYESPLKGEDREEAWHDVFGDERRYNDPIGNVRLVKKLSEDVRASKAVDYRRMLDHARLMLARLGETDPETARRRELYRILKSWQAHCDRMHTILRCVGMQDAVEKKAKEVMAELRLLRRIQKD
jgi:hypothetical protein